MSEGEPMMDSRRLGDPGTALFHLDKYPFYLLNRAASRYNRIIEARLRRIGVDVPTWRVLMILGEAEPRSIGRIADSAVINLSTMMRIVERMEKGGLVVTAANPDDARVTDVRLASAGREQLAAARQVTAPVYAKLIRGFSAREFDRLLALIGKLQANLDAINAPE
ncbi:MarR family winged helix-turn-helix transcriptional regulator [Allosphingosinicella indica]|uniref:DNA-binding transcriptional regulator, MarR family n=1 Tax=Allosphingosinicella indica TaxID=941907 RepID=A0A1X7G0W3_9SPHN|nr:MarR family transcriptional regulator [Allosphingosinicella indica]SMF61896.1 DNA-binding transcriptional regulator, MarR family [Allosphingosinicella indica]